MNVTSLELTADVKKSVLESAIKKMDIIEEYDIEELDKGDGRKDIIIAFKNPVHIKYVSEALVPLMQIEQHSELKE